LDLAVTLLARRRWTIATLPVVVLYFSEAPIRVNLAFVFVPPPDRRKRLACRGPEKEEKRMTEENEKLVRAFYEATVPGHRESLRAIQAPHVVYDLPKGMPIGCGHFEGLDDVLQRFLASFYGALDVRFIAEEFVTAGESVVAIGRIEGTTRKAGVPVNVPFAHVWTVRDGYLQRLRAFTDTALLAEALAKS
jgi:ketosteroid isomerase-like protein